MVLIRPLLPEDIPAAQRLREQSGWNQTADDWRRLLAWSPDGCWVAEQDGQVVGTAAVICYGRRVAWIGMVLVDEQHRRRGIGRALLHHAIGHLDGLGVQTIALDATPEGRPLYAALGFGDAFELARWRWAVRLRTARAGATAAPDARVGLDPPSGATVSGADVVIRAWETSDLGPVSAYDAGLFGTDRTHVLAALRAGHHGHGFVAERRGQLVGYALGRPGAQTWHLGPFAADDAAAAERLARACLRSAGAGEDQAADDPDAGVRETVMDVVMPNRAAVALAQQLGLVQVRRFIRMARGAPLPPADLDRLYTSAGPELG